MESAQMAPYGSLPIGWLNTKRVLTVLRLSSVGGDTHGDPGARVHYMVLKLE